LKNSSQLKALIRNYSKNNNVSAQKLLRNYMHERFLERVSLSRNKNNFVLKGGQLISVLVGLDSRSTMDMDATIKGMFVDKNLIVGIIEEILAVEVDDNVSMRFRNVQDIRAETDGGYRVSIDTIFDGIFQNIKIDITIGDVITPSDLRYELKLMFEDRKIAILGYNLETIFSEKLETIISRGTASTRIRDYYDIYLLFQLHKDAINHNHMAEAFYQTVKKRGTQTIIKDKELILKEIKSSDALFKIWNRYQKEYKYAEAVEWKSVLKAVSVCLSMCEQRKSNG
jgi:predicted nucleotidyltransferase component of viral defense system